MAWLQKVGVVAELLSRGVNPDVRTFEMDVVRKRYTLAFEMGKMTEVYDMSRIEYMVWNTPGEATTVLLAKQALDATRLDGWFYGNVEDKVEEAKARLPPAPDSRSAARREALKEIRRQSVQVHMVKYFPAVSYTAVSRNIQSPIAVALPKGWGYALGVRTVWTPFANLSFTYINDNELAIKDGWMNTDNLKIMPLL